MGTFGVLIDISSFIFIFTFCQASQNQELKNKKQKTWFCEKLQKVKMKNEVIISISTKKYPFEPSSNHALLFHINS